ncbi:MAG: murein hydrolase activator EnvC family protein [Candidatus Binatia bacterium]
MDRPVRDPRRRSRAARMGACVAVLAILATGLEAGAQSTRQRLDEARRRVSQVKSSYQRIAEEYARQDAAMDRTDVQIAKTRADIARAEQRTQELSSELKERVRSAYRSGGLGSVELLLQAQSFREFSLRLIALERQSLQDEDLILKLRKEAAELAAKQEELRRQREVHKSQLASLQEQGRRLQISFSQARALEQELEGQLRAEEIAKLFRVGGGSGSARGIRIPLDACPVRGPHTFSNDWGAPRGGGSRRHQGNDLMAAAGTPIVAPVSGTVTRWRNGGNGGISLYLWGNDNNEYYFAHNTRNVAPAGSKVSAGQQVATVGNTGNARGGAPHLHFEIHPGGGGAINPYPSLVAVC